MVKTTGGKSRQNTASLDVTIQLTRVHKWQGEGTRAVPLVRRGRGSAEVPCAAWEDEGLDALPFWRAPPRPAARVTFMPIACSLLRAKC